MRKRRFLVTAALPYSNGHLHVGHIAGAYLPADIYVRFLKACGEDVRFICGSDDNGVSSLIAARKEGKAVEELTAYYHASQKKSFDGLGIRFHIYGGTHQPGFVELHNRLSQSMFLSIHEKGHLYKKTTKQLYDVKAGQFLPDRFVKGGCYHDKIDGEPCGYSEAYGDQCEACGNAIDPLKLNDPVSTITGTAPEPRETVHWYLKLGKLAEIIGPWLESKRTHGDDSPAWREFVLNFSLGQIQQGLPDRAMTRDLEWGVPVPLDDPDAAGKCLYVWFDAPIGYVSFTAAYCERHDGDWRQYETWWKDPDSRIVHFVGEDNTIFHALTWPAMLMAEGSYQLPWQVVVNAFLNIKFPERDEEKISKSRGTGIWINDYLERFDPDPLRYYLTAIAPETARTTFDIEDFISRTNNELSNALGNFINRTLTFAVRYFGGKVPDPGRRGSADRDQLALLQTCANNIAAHLSQFRFKAGLTELMTLARAANGYFDVKQPWNQRKNDMAACGVTINVCLQTAKTLMILMAPFLPFSAERTAGMLGLRFEDSIIPWSELAVELPPGHLLGEPVILYRKIERDEFSGTA